jgi:predicted DNA-binding transcriptional regulator YafY
VRTGTRVFGEHKGPPLERYDKDHLYIPSGAEQEVEIRFSEKLAPLVLDQWPESATRGPDGSLMVRTLLPPGNYLLSWVLGYGGNAEVAGPPELRGRLAERVSVLAAMYGQPAKA